MSAEAAVLSAALNTIAAFIGDDDVVDGSAAVIDILGGAIDRVHESIGEQIDDANQGVNQRHVETRGLIQDEIERAIFANEQTSDAATREIVNQITQRIDDTGGALDNVVAEITRAVTQSQGNTENLLTGFGNQLTGQISDVVIGVGSILDQITGGLSTTINNQIIIPSGVFDAVLAPVTGVIDGAIAEASATVTRVTDLFQGIFQEQLDIQRDIGLLQSDSLERIALETEQTGPWERQTYQRMNSPESDGYGGTFIESILERIAQDDILTGQEIHDAAMDALFDGQNPADVIARCNIRFSTASLGPDWATKFVDWITSALSIAILPMNMAQVQSNRQMWEFRQCFPDTLPPPGDTASMLHHGFMGGSEAIDNLSKQGYSREHAKDMLATSYRMPDITLLWAMLLRGDIDKDAFDYSLGAQGYNPAYIDPLRELSLFIPPVQDLITMAVREVFSEEQARANGQFDDFPAEFEEFAAKQGVSREWAERYWAAHWVLPSPQMGFEMFHRRVIDEKRLRGLMTALDIMPGWRDEMIAISYNPLTRVDVRRMHAMGVIDDEQVRDAYLDIGYSPENAELMLRFTKEYNEGESVAELDIASDLTRASILNFYKDGTLGRPETLALLLQAGINAVAAELFIADADFDMERRERQDELDLIYGRFEYGSITFEQASDQIRAQPLTEREIELALLELEKLSERMNKLPSRAELDKFIAAGIINETDYINTMRKRGYSLFWAERYLMLAKEGISADENES